MLLSLLKSIFHNIAVVLVGFGVALLGRELDSLFGVGSFQPTLVAVAGWLLVGTGFILRASAAFYFYQHRMQVISLKPQGSLIVTGPFAISRNPLYLGGNVLIFFGAALVLGSPSALVITAAHIPLVDLFVRREEKQLEKRFGAAWLSYRERVRRWI